MSKKDDEDKLLRDKGFDPAALSEDERKDALKMIAEESGTLLDNPTPPEPPKSDGLRYFKSQIAGLTVQVGPPLSHEVAPQTVRFVPYEEKFQGDPVKVGYLATDNAVAIKKCRADDNVEEIDKDEFEKATTGKNAKRVAY